MKLRYYLCMKHCSEASFSGSRFFYKPEISDSGPTARSPSQRTCAEDFYALKNLSPLARFKPVYLVFRGQHATNCESPGPTSPTSDIVFSCFPNIHFFHSYSMLAHSRVWNLDECPNKFLPCFLCRYN